MQYQAAETYTRKDPPVAVNIYKEEAFKGALQL